MTRPNLFEWTTRLGYEGPTDSCLILTHPYGGEKEFLIESLGWKLLCRCRRSMWETFTVWNNVQWIDADIAKHIWDLPDGWRTPPKP